MSTGEILFLHEFIRRQGEKIQIVLKSFKGKHYIDLRLWFQEGPDQDFLPSRKGVSFELEHLAEFRQGFEQLVKAAEQLQAARHTGESAKSMKFSGQRNKLYSPR